MRIFDFFYLSFQNFKNRKLRTLFTVMGVAVGIGTILFFVSLGYGLQEKVLGGIVTKESLLTLDATPSEHKLFALNQQSLQEIAQIKNIEKVIPRAILSGQASLEGLISETTINVIDPEFFLLAGIIPQYGQVFNQDHQQKIVINSSMAEIFNLKSEQIIGKKVSLLIFNPQSTEGIVTVKTVNPSEKFEIIGIVVDPGASNTIYLKKGDVPLSIKEYHFVQIKVNTVENMETVKGELVKMGFLVTAFADLIEETIQIFQIIQLILGIFGVFALIVAAIGLINTMTISLLERTNEIGIMRAIGAAPKDIKKIFLGESLIIGFFGGVIGIGIGILGAEIFNLLINILAIRAGAETVSIFVYPI